LLFHLGIQIQINVPALKAHFNWQGVRTGAGTESRFQRWLFLHYEILGRCPRLLLNMLRLQRENTSEKRLRELLALVDRSACVVGEIRLSRVCGEDCLPRRSAA
jgi:hypothetical protein